jgi:Family of unknown function (DUF5995)
MVVGDSNGHPQNLNEVIEALTEIIRISKDEESRVGFFAAMYGKVTVRVRTGVESGLFEDGPRMDRLATTFASRYLTAVDQFRNGTEPSRCWDFAFKTATMRRPLIIQHLLMGINAHINLDLGIAAAQTSPGDGLGDLRNDFVQINDLLAHEVATIREEIGDVSPWIRLLDRIDPDAGSAIINFSIERARDQAWTVAELLACLPPDSWQERITVLDRNAVTVGRLVRDPPGWILRVGLRLIRIREKGDVRRVIEVLDEP